jgi:hypothetical protein
MGAYNMKQDFKTWMNKVDGWLYKKCGLTSNDLADFCYRDAYDNGERPASIGKRVLEAEGYYD